VEDNDLRKGVISLYHDSTTAGHPGITKTLWSISRDFWWPNMKDTITNYIKGCALCQSRKNNPTNPKPPPFPIPSDTYTLPFKSIALDFITKLPNSHTYDTILTITDTFSKASIFIPCNETIDSEKTALLYATYVLPHYGLPSCIISDRDPRFTSTFTKELCRLLQIDQNISTAYHPQTDGQSERTNQWLEQYLRIFTNFQQNDWASWLPLAQYAHNSWPNATTKKAPFELIMGHIPRVHQTTRTSTSPSVETRLQNVTEVRQQVAEAIRRSQELVTHIPTRFTPYCVGDKVWLDAKNLNTSHPSAKLGPKRYGPFLVTAAVSHTSFRLKLPPQWKIHNVFHASLLTPYNETTTHGPNFQEPPPDLIDGQPEWEVEQILGARRRRNQLQYLVRWKGFSEAHDSWEPLSHINAEQLIEDFRRQNPDAVNTVELITNTPASTSPITIRRITMSSPEYTSADSTPASPAPTSPPPLIARLNLPLAARIDNEDEPSSPVSTTVLSTHPHSPASTEPCDYEVDLAMHGFSIAIPRDFIRFDRSIPNHHRYGKKIHMPDRTVRWPQYIRFVFDHDTQQHFVAATRNNLDNGRDQYGWTLEAAPFTGPAIANIDDSELDILADSGPDKLKVDIALHAVNDKGISADVSRLRHLATQRRALQE
jgi:transposase InsO family protein